MGRLKTAVSYSEELGFRSFIPKVLLRGIKINRLESLLHSFCLAMVLRIYIACSYMG